jgi:Flp pilus assembly protein CpaB
MKPKTMILMVVAIACGLAASYMTSRLIAERNNQPAENQVTVVFAKKKVSAYTAIKKPDDLFELRQVTESPLTAKAVKTLEELQGKRLNKTISEDSIVRVDDLQKKEDMIIDIPVGQRAIAIKVTAESLAGGFILPGSRVDILSTMRRNDEPSSMIILQNMLVMAIDTRFTRDAEQSTMIGQTVTLAATPEECTRLALAAQQGELRLTLRSQDDKRPVTIGTTRMGDLSRQVRDSSSAEGGSGDNGDSGNPSVLLGSLGKVANDPPPPVPTPAPQQEKKEEPPPAKTHTLLIQEGEFSQRAVFTWDEDNQTWRNGSLTRNAEDAAPTTRRPGATAPALQNPIQQAPAQTPAPPAAPAPDTTHKKS